MGIPVGSSDLQMTDDDRGYQVRRSSDHKKSQAMFAEQSFSHSSQSDSTDTSSSSVTPSRPPPGPCAILQGFAYYHHSSGCDAHSMRDAELSQLVFSHREAFMACPSAHRGCSAGFKGLASVLDKQAQLVDGSIGMDVVGMLRTEAWLLSGWSA